MPTTTTDPIDALLYIYNGYQSARWNFTDAVGTPSSNPGGIGNAVALTYSFLSSNPRGSGETGFGIFDNPMRVATSGVLGSVAEFARIDFSPVASQAGQITFGMSSQQDSSAFAYPPHFNWTVDGSGTITSVEEHPHAGNVWVNTGVDWEPTDWQPGSQGYMVLLHELGHALGLKHPFEGGADNGGFTLDPSLDNEAHTVMSYTSAPRSLLLEVTGDEQNGYSWSLPTLAPSTMMPLDIAALQHLYGANTSTRAGNTVYRWNRNEELLETVWDGGGIDRIDAGNQVFGCRINLNDGAYSSIGLRTTTAEIRAGLEVPDFFSLDNLTADQRAALYNGANNLAIARGVVIENVVGGAGNDDIVGNTVNNHLAGGAGADALAGARGNDRLVGGGGRDLLSGQDGNDLLTGGTGLDRLNGGAGRDVFDFNALAETGSTLASADVISGFVAGVDRIDLSSIDARAGQDGNQAFTYIGTQAFSSTDAAGQLRFQDGVLYGSTDTDSFAELAIRLTGVATLAAADIVL